jgi:hypothetical protein
MTTLSEKYCEIVQGNSVTQLIAPTGYGKTSLVWHNLSNVGKKKCLWIDCRLLINDPNPRQKFINEVNSFGSNFTDFNIAIDYLSSFDGIIVIDNLEFCYNDESGMPIGYIRSWPTVKSGNEGVLAPEFKWIGNLLHEISLIEVSIGDHLPRLVITTQYKYKNYFETSFISLADTKYFFSMDESKHFLESYDKKHKVFAKLRNCIDEWNSNSEGKQYNFEEEVDRLIKSSDGIPGILKISYELLAQAFASDQIFSIEDLDSWQSLVLNNDYNDDEALLHNVLI